MLGELLYARYKVTNILGAGGFSKTYIAEDTQRPGNPHCVLKHLAFDSPKPELLRQARRLFQAEAESLEKLGHHDRIPQLLAYFEHQREFFLVQEYISGQSLAAELQERRLLAAPRVVELLEDVLQTLAFVHERGVIHRDIKPENLMRRAADQRLVVIDFGAVKAIGTTAIAEAGDTHLSSPVYTPGYAASEQCLGTPRYASDIYSLGMVAIQALTGLRPTQLPQDNITCEVIWRDKAQVDEGLAAILTRMTRYHIQNRYASAQEVLADLAAYRAGEVPQALRQLTGSNFHDAKTDLQQPHSPWQRLHHRPWQRFVGWGVALALGLGASWGGRSLFSSQNLIPSFWGAENLAESGQTPGNPNPRKLTDRISSGDRLLNRWNVSEPKRNGAKAFSAGNYDQAITAFAQARQQDPTDPETLIYLHNARIATHPAHQVAVTLSFEAGFNSSVELLRGIAQAQDRVNQAGGIQGKPLKLLLLDDGNSPAIATALAQHLVQQSEILAVIGHASSDASLAAAPIYQQHLVMISPLSSAVKLSGLGDFIFRTMPSDRMMAQALGKHLLQTLKKQRTVAFFSSQSSYSDSLKTEFKNALFYNGVELVGEFDLARPDFDAGASLQATHAQKADAIFLAPDAKTLDAAMQVVEVNQRQLPILGGDVLFNPKLLNTGTEGIGMVVAVPSLVLATKPTQFQRQFAQLWRDAPANWRAALGYDALQAVITALQQEPSRLGVQQQLRRAHFAAAGASGPVSFQATGDRTAPVNLMSIHAQGGKFQFKALKPQELPHRP